MTHRGTGQSTKRNPELCPGGAGPGQTSSQQPCRDEGWADHSRNKLAGAQAEQLGQSMAHWKPCQIGQETNHVAQSRSGTPRKVACILGTCAHRSHVHRTKLTSGPAHRGVKAADLGSMT